MNSLLKNTGKDQQLNNNQKLEQEKYQQLEQELYLQQAQNLTVVENLELKIKKLTAELEVINNFSHSIFEQTAVGVAMFDCKNELQLANSKYCKILGYNLQELRKCKEQDLTVAKDLMIERKYRHQLFSGTINNFTIEKKYINSQRNLVWVKLTVYALKDILGRLQYRIEIIKEIDSNKHFEIKHCQNKAKLAISKKKLNSGKFTINLSGNLCYFSPEIHSILGLNNQQKSLNKKDFLKIVHTQDSIRVKQYLKQVTKNSIAAEIKFWITTADATWRYVYVYSQPVFDEQEKLIEVSSTITDITDIKKTESRLKTREKRYRAVVEDQTEFICRFFPDGTISFANQAYCNYLNLPIEQLIGNNLLDLVTDEEQFQVRQRLQNFFDLTPKSPTVRVDHSVTNINGKIIWQSWTYRAIFNHQQQILEIQAVGRDITELKQTQQQLKASQQKYKTLFETLPIGVAISDQSGKIIEVNSALEKVLGFSDLTTNQLHLDHLTAKLWRADGTKMPQEECAIYQAWQENLVVYNQERGLLNHNQVTTWLSITAAPIPLEGFGVAVACLDTTQTKQAAQMREEFLCVASHELRTPLTSLKGSLGLLKTGQLGKLNDAGQQLLEFAFLDTERLVRLVKDILELQRLKLANQTLEAELCRIEQLVGQAVQIIEPLAKEAEISLSVSTTSIAIWAHGDRLIQVLTNLLGNAIKFSSPGGKVWLNTEVQARQVIFQVIDQGKGIPLHQQDTIFEPFRQVRDGNTHQRKGTGLGLAICRTIVEQYGGSIGVESTPGKGSIFYFTVPR